MLICPFPLTCWILTESLFLTFQIDGEYLPIIGILSLSLSLTHTHTHTRAFRRLLDVEELRKSISEFYLHEIGMGRIVQNMYGRELEANGVGAVPRNQDGESV